MSAQRADVSTGQRYTWRKELMQENRANGFARLITAEEPRLAATQAPSAAGMPVPVYELPAIELEVKGRKLRIPPTMPPVLAAAIVKALVSCR